MLEASEIVTGYNIAWIMSAAVVAIAFTGLTIRRIRLGQRDYTTDLIFGVALVSYGSILHRIFWLVYGWQREAGHSEIAEALVVGAIPVGIVSALFVTIGYSYHFAPVARRLFGRWWKLIMVAVLNLSFWGSALVHHLFF